MSSSWDFRGLAESATMPGVLRPTAVAWVSALLLTAPALARAESAVDPSRAGPHPVAMVEVTYLMSLPRGGHFAFAPVCPRACAGCPPGDLPLETAHRLISARATALFTVFLAADPRWLPALEGNADADLTVTGNGVSPRVPG